MFFALMRAAQAQELRQQFLAALDQASENAKGERKTGSGEKYSIKKSTEGFLFVDVDEDEIDLNDGRSVASVIAELIHDKFNNLISVNGQQIQINKTTNDEWRHSKDARALQKRSTIAYEDKIKTIANADEILQSAQQWIGEKAKHDHFVEYARGKIYYKVNQNGYAADVIVGIKTTGAANLYDLVNIEEYKITEARVTKGEELSLRSAGASVESSISQSSENVNPESGTNSDTDAEIDWKVKNALGIPAMTEAEKSLAAKVTELEQINRDLERQIKDYRMQLGAGGVQHVTDIRAVKVIAKKNCRLCP